MERVLQARIIFCAVEMLRESVYQYGNADCEGSTSLHFAIFEDGGPEFFLDVADAVDIISRHVRDKSWVTYKRAGFAGPVS